LFLLRELLNIRYWGFWAGVAGWRFRARFFFMEVRKSRYCESETYSLLPMPFRCYLRSNPITGKSCNFCAASEINSNAVSDLRLDLEMGICEAMALLLCTVVI
jgi:hypothetical protein